jgi:hypothetical protein
METFIIAVIFSGIPLALFCFIMYAAAHRAGQKRKLIQAAEKYLKS